jgi:hypothetical protein
MPELPSTSFGQQVRRAVVPVEFLQRIVADGYDVDAPRDFGHCVNRTFSNFLRKEFPEATRLKAFMFNTISVASKRSFSLVFEKLEKLDLRSKPTKSAQKICA